MQRKASNYENDTARNRTGRLLITLGVERVSAKALHGTIPNHLYHISDFVHESQNSVEQFPA